MLLHGGRGTITGTARWLAGRRIAMHHHVALDEQGDIARLARFVHGTARGLVACGGGAYCAAHIGLYKALQQANVAFDMMGGTSGGSAMTAAFAMGTAPDDVDRATHDIFVTNKAMRRYTWPRYSLLDHKHFDDQLARYYRGVDIEDLWIPYFAVSTNLTSHDLHRHRHGDLWAAIRASGSMPVLLPPYYTADGHMLVDGAILDNVPVKVMHELKSGPNVVISFSVPKHERFEVDYAALPGRGDLLKRMLHAVAARHAAGGPRRRHRIDAGDDGQPPGVRAPPAAAGPAAGAALPARHGHPRLAPPHRADAEHLPLGPAGARPPPGRRPSGFGERTIASSLSRALGA